MRTLDQAPLGISLEEDMLEGHGLFGDRIYLIKVGENLYAANNVSLPDGQQINGLAAFLTPDDATSYMKLDMARGISGEIQGKAFEDARQLAISKPKLSAILLFAANHIIDVCWVR